jgi:general stress protein 26
MPIQQVNKCLQNWFNFPTEKVFCQVSTLANNNTPHVRTMDLYHVTPEGNIVLLTETSNRKWRDLMSCHNIAICLFNIDLGQIIVEGSASLKTYSNDSKTTAFYWNNFLDPYWRDFYIVRDANFNASSDDIPSSFGVIIVQPVFWEIIEIDNKDFLNSSRKQYHLEDGAWIMREIPPV